MGVFYRDTTSVRCLSLDSPAPRLQDVNLSTFQTLARDLRNLSHLDSHWWPNTLPTELLGIPVFVLVDVDLQYWTSKVEHIVSFTAIFINICTAHAQKRLFMNFRYKVIHRRSIRRPRFPVRVQNFGDLATFWIFAFYMPNVRHISTSGLFDLLTPTSIIPSKFKAPAPIRSWVMSDNVSHFLMVTNGKRYKTPLTDHVISRMRRISYFFNTVPCIIFADNFNYIHRRATEVV